MTSAALLLIPFLLGQGTAMAQSADDDPLAALPEGPGREESYYLCSACHDFTLVTQQRLSRARWDGLMEWMIAEQNMPPPDPAERAVILDYLATHYGPASEPGKTRRRR